MGLLVKMATCRLDSNHENFPVYTLEPPSIQASFLSIAITSYISIPIVSFVIICLLEADQGARWNPNIFSGDNGSWDCKYTLSTFKLFQQSFWEVLKIYQLENLSTLPIRRSATFEKLAVPLKVWFACSWFILCYFQKWGTFHFRPLHPADVLRLRRKCSKKGER